MRRKAIAAFGGETDGTTAVEYGLIAALVVLTAMGAITTFGESASGLWEDLAKAVNAALNGAG